jgi:Ca2+-binding RTX toxin-like protein
MRSQFAFARVRFGLARSLRRGILAAGVAGLAVAPAAHAVSYPVAGGNGFDSNAQGWTGITATCTPNMGSLCTVDNAYKGSVGNPKGSIESRTDVLVNAGEFFTGKGTWRSPSFEATTIGGGTLSYDRQFDVGGLAALEPTTTVTDVLVDETATKSKALGTETLNKANSAFAAHTVVVRAGTLVLGHRYHLELRATMTTTAAQAGLLGSIAARYDNVEMELENTGGGGSSGSPGVTFTAPPLSQKHISKLITKIKWAAEAGHLPGGSVVAIKDCTIVGTPGRDTIRGTNGNDVICGLGGNDKINGRGGRDVIDGGSGSDRLSGAGGADVLAGLAGRDRAKGGPGADRLGGGAAADRASGGGGKDRLKTGSGADRLAGNGGKDRLSGGPGRDRLAGSAGPDRLRSVERR